MSTKQVPISKIIAIEEIMPRDKIDQDYVDDLFEDLEAGAKFAPVCLIFDGKQYYLVDGFHRLEAAKKAGHAKIEAVIQKGNKRDALLFSSSANANNGKRRTNEDKRKAVNRLLMDSEWCKWTDVRIADHCKVSSAFVGILRTELTLKGLMSPSERVDSKGRNLNVEKIGRCKSLEQVTGIPPLAKVPLPVQNPPKQSSTTDASETKTNPSVKQKAKPKKGKPKTLRISDAEKSEIRKQISEATARMQKLDEMLETNKIWTKDKAKKFMNTNEEIELRCLGISRFAQSLNSKLY